MMMLKSVKKIVISFGDNRWLSYGTHTVSPLSVCLFCTLYSPLPP